ncbi:hypothetical protein RND81_05G136500 [Saponaria officinalis]|uniref:UBC core domain-containing protein n=1 Tax=Saponaria officinalis TaxID=3572 RepID=A0AAW1KYU1_SAPOF
MNDEIAELGELPRSIMVRTWSGRRDLFQAPVLGPNHTPYEECLFVFNIKVTDNYSYKSSIVRFQYPHINIGKNISGMSGVTSL